MILAGLLFAALLPPVTAQGFRFGLKGGAGVSNLQFGGFTADPSDQPKYAGLQYNRSGNYFPSIWLGAVAEYDLTTSLLASAGVQLTPRFAKSEKKDLLPDYENEVSLNLYYLQVPLVLHYHTRKFFFGAGVYGGLCFAGKYKWKETYYDLGIAYPSETDNPVEFGSDTKSDNLKRLDFGLHGEIGYVFKTLRLSLVYDHGLLNNVPNGDYDSYKIFLNGELKQRALYAMVTYYWLAK